MYRDAHEKHEQGNQRKRGKLRVGGGHLYNLIDWTIVSSPLVDRLEGERSLRDECLPGVRLEESFEVS